MNSSKIASNSEADAGSVAEGNLAHIRMLEGHQIGHLYAFAIDLKGHRVTGDLDETT